MITETKERPATAEERYNLSKKEFEAAYTAEIDYLNQRLKAVENDEEVIDIITNLENTNMTYTMLCFSLPYYQKYYEWEITDFVPPFVQPDELEQAISVMDRGLEDSAVQAYINLKYKDDAQYIKTILNCVDTPPKATKPLTKKEKKLFTIYLEQVFKPAFLDFLENVKQNKYRPFKDILEELKELLPVFQEVRNNINHKAEILKAEIYRSKNDLTALIMQYAEKSGFLDKLSSKTEGKKKPADTVATPFEISPYSLKEYTRVFSNPLALSVMNMYTSEEIRGNKSANLLDDVPKKTYKPRRRDDHKGIITEIVIEAIEGGKITACWGATEKRIFALYNEFICKSGSNLNSPFVITLDDYIKKCGLSSSASAKKETRKNVKNALFSLLHTSISNTENQNLYIGVNLFQTAVLSNNTIFVMGSYPLVEALSEKNQTMFLPPEYFTYKGKDAVSFMNIVQTLCYNYGNYNNVNAADKFKNHRNEKISVKSLLASTDIVTIKEIEKRRISWKQKIKEPLEAKLNTFPGADNWNYMYNDRPITAENLPNTLTYSEWEQLVIRYNIDSFPLETVTEAIAKKKARVQQKLQIQADQAAIARDRSEQRQERKARKAKKKPE